MRLLRAFARTLGASAVCLGSVATALAAPAEKPVDDAADIAGFSDKLRAYTDGKSHYVVLVPFEISGPTFFYGDGKDFWLQRSFGGGRSGDEAFNRSFWDPRSESAGEAEFAFRQKEYKLDCAGRTTKLTPVSDAESAKIVAAAHFHRPRWKWQSYWLARDEHGVYYYVDRQREPAGNKSFRLYVGPKGSLKLQKMMNIVSDSKGEIFSTKGGELRLVSSASDGKWIKGHDTLKLTIVPIEDNHVLVYTDLGVYTGERLGTACDDL
jgi:hypothetical protein